MSRSTDELVQARLEKNASLEHVHEVTKIPIIDLEAIENEKFDQLPTRLALSYIRTYAEMMNVDRNTINNDLRILYNKALNDYDPNVITLDDILQKQLVRLEMQRYRLSLYLCDAKDLTSKIAVERLISDIDFRLIGVIERINLNVARFWEEVIKKINNAAESEKLKTRYTSAFELNRISIYSRKRLDKLKEEILDEKNHV